MMKLGVGSMGNGGSVLPDAVISRGQLSLTVGNFFFFQRAEYSPETFQKL